MAKRQLTWQQVCVRAGVPTNTNASLEMVQMLCDHRGHSMSLQDVCAAYGRWVWEPEQRT